MVAFHSYTIEKLLPRFFLMIQQANDLFVYSLQEQP